MPRKKDVRTGQCLCGAVAYEVRAFSADAHACHCLMCRRQSGHYVVAISAKRSDFKLTEDRGLKWYRSSDRAKRGFCGACGSALFWDDGGEEVVISVGNLNAPTGLSVHHHIYVADKGDYYAISDDLPQYIDHETPARP